MKMWMQFNVMPRTPLYSNADGSYNLTFTPTDFILLAHILPNLQILGSISQPDHYFLFTNPILTDGAINHSEGEILRMTSDYFLAQGFNSSIYVQRTLFQLIKQSQNVKDTIQYIVVRRISGVCGWR